jgi:hypothetical protein
MKLQLLRAAPNAMRETASNCHRSSCNNAEIKARTPE